MISGHLTEIRELNVLIHDALTEHKVVYYVVNGRMMTIDGVFNLIHYQLDTATTIVGEMYKLTKENDYTWKIKFTEEYHSLLDDRVVFNQTYSYYKCRYDDPRERLDKYIYEVILTNI